MPAAGKRPWRTGAEAAQHCTAAQQACSLTLAAAADIMASSGLQREPNWVFWHASCSPNS